MATTIPSVERPEDVLDNFIKNGLGLPAYVVGVFDLDKLEPKRAAFLASFKDVMNDEALRPQDLDGRRFHFDYLEVRNGKSNAFAFTEGNYAFIVVTMPLVDSCGDLSLRLCRSPIVRQILGLHHEAHEAEEVGELQRLLFINLLSLLGLHEYTHLVHKHSGTGAMVWNEFSPSGPPKGSLHAQAQELDADGYAGYLLLQGLLRGSPRHNALATLKQRESSPSDADQLLLALFFVTALSLFCEFWSLRKVHTSSFYDDDHPLPPVRIKYILEVAKMWCDQNGLDSPWFTPAGSQELFRAVAGMIEPSRKGTWDVQMAALASPAGVAYDGELFKAFEAVRQKPDVAF